MTQVILLEGQKLSFRPRGCTFKRLRPGLSRHAVSLDKKRYSTFSLSPINEYQCQNAGGGGGNPAMNKHPIQGGGGE